MFFDSTPEEGTTALVSLPIEGPDAHGQLTKSADVLLIDDDESFVEATSRIFEPIKYQRFLLIERSACLAARKDLRPTSAAGVPTAGIAPMAVETTPVVSKPL